MNLSNSKTTSACGTGTVLRGTGRYWARGAQVLGCSTALRHLDHRGCTGRILLKTQQKSIMTASKIGTKMKWCPSCGAPVIQNRPNHQLYFRRMTRMSSRSDWTTCWAARAGRSYLTFSTSSNKRSFCFFSISSIKLSWVILYYLVLRWTKQNTIDLNTYKLSIP